VTIVDGIPVTVGSVAWRDGNVGVRRCKLEKHHLGMWWSWLQKEIYSTERAALVGAIDRERADLKKARRKVRSADKTIARLRARLAACEEKP
jgi:hypothetical protein